MCINVFNIYCTYKYHPINIYSERDMLLEEINTVICERNATEILRTNLTVKGMFMDGIYT